VWSKKDATASGSLIISNPTKSPLAASSGPVLAVTSTVPKGAQQPPPDSGRGKLRAFRPYNGPFDVPQAILEYPIPGCLAGADDKPVTIAPGKAVTCAFRTPLAAVAGTDPRTVNVSVSFAVGADGTKGGGSGSGSSGGMCAADAVRMTAV
jgi:hypothetical protein